MIGAAFFDLDRTFIRRSSALALAGAFRRSGIITRRELARGALFQLRFAALGAGPRTVEDVTARGMRVLRGVAPAELEQIAAEGAAGIVRRLVFPQAQVLAAGHQRRGEPVFLVTATLQEIVEPLAAALGLDGALGSLGRVGPDGRYTGEVLRACHGAGKAAAVRGLARERGLDLAASVAYTDGYSDLPLLEAVGRRVAVNPDRALRRLARQRGWQVLDFRRAPARLLARAAG